MDPKRRFPLPSWLVDASPTWMERVLARRLLRHLEPWVESVVHRALRSSAGQEILADTVADVLGELLLPEGAPEGGLAERLLLSLVARYLSRPGFARRLEALLAQRPPPS
jgi:hypothetical protein